MIARALAILEAITGGPVDADLANRIIAAFLPENVDPATLTNLEKATLFVREYRRLTKLRVLQFEEQIATEAAMLAVRADVETDIILGDD